MADLRANVKRESDGALQAQAPNTPVTLPIHGEMREALQWIAAFCEAKRKGTDDWFDLTEIGLRARNALQGDGL